MPGTAAVEGGSAAEALRQGRRRLAAAGIDSAALDARLLLAAALGLTPERLLSHPEQPLQGAAAGAYDELIARRAAGWPVSRLVGRRGFWELELELDGAVLDPRPDSEALVEAVLARLPDRERPLRLLDLGVGSGCLLLSLLYELPRAWGVGVDLSPAAVSCARRNAVRLGLADRAHFLAGDWAAALEARFDVIVCNPPYVLSSQIAGLPPEVRDHDPRLALDGGGDGLDGYRAVAAELPRLLTPAGMAAIECGAGQADRVGRILEAAALAVLETRPDLAGVPRCLIVSSVGQVATATKKLLENTAEDARLIIEGSVVIPDGR